MRTAGTPRSQWRRQRRCSPHAGLPLARSGLAGAAMPSSPARKLIIACGALAHEIAALRRANGWSTLDVKCLPPELHNRPERIAPAVREAIRANRDQYADIF